MNQAPPYAERDPAQKSTGLLPSGGEECSQTHGQ